MADQKHSETPRGRSLDRALNVLDAIGRAGLVVVPLEPTRHMVQRVAREGGVSQEAARRIYRALVAGAD
jgi:hypothetical protein